MMRITFCVLEPCNKPTIVMKIVLALAACVLLVGITLAYPYQDSQEYEKEPRLVRFVPLRRRVARKVPMHGRIMVPRRPASEEERDLVPDASEPIASGTGHGHSHQPYDYVDYGAYTGGYGAFGWYSDHPVYSSHGHY